MLYTLFQIVVFYALNLLPSLGPIGEAIRPGLCVAYLWLAKFRRALATQSLDIYPLT